MMERKKIKKEIKKEKRGKSNKKISKVNKEVEEPRFQMNENVTELVLVTLRNGVEEGKRFSNEEKDPMTSKELNEEPYEMKISCTVL
jgi:F0F1-type ATP synthase membrane subunit b/b'